MKPKWWQGGLFYFLILVAIIALAFTFLPATGGPNQVDLYSFIEQAKRGEIDTIVQDETTIVGLKDDDEKIESSFIGSTKELIDTLEKEGVILGEGGIKIDAKPRDFDWGSVIISFVPLLLFGALLFFMFRSVRKKS